MFLLYTGRAAAAGLLRNTCVFRRKMQFLFLSDTGPFRGWGLAMTIVLNVIFSQNNVVSLRTIILRALKEVETGTEFIL